MFKLIIEFNSLIEEETGSQSIKKITKNIDRACLFIPTQGTDPINFTIIPNSESYTKVSGVKEITVTHCSLNQFDAKNRKDFKVWLSQFVKK